MIRDEPRLIQGGLVVDDLGTIKFVNEFDFTGIKRFYIVETHKTGIVRAWHGHRHECKYVTMVQGAALVAAVRIENWDAPPRDSKVHRYVLTARNPSVLYIPAGYANGFKSLTAETGLMFFSNARLEESRADDIRFSPDHFGDVWIVAEHV